MATTKNYYTGNGTATAFTFTFPYLNTAHIKVKLDKAVLATTEYTLTPTSNPTTVNFNTAPTNLAQIEIYRETSLTTANNVFAAGSSVKAASLNDNQTQTLYALEEQDNSIEKEKYLTMLMLTIVQVQQLLLHLVRVIHGLIQ